MEWIQSIMQWARTLFEQVGFRPAALPLAFVLGLASAIASTCCTLPLLGAIVGYSGMREDRDRRTRFLAALFFMLGTTVALLILGAVAGSPIKVDPAGNPNGLLVLLSFASLALLLEYS